jgi:homogentisate 1,2-dioxygenase
MPYYRTVGEVPPKRHTQFRQPDGSLFAEELMGEEGFSFDSALLYHRHPPTALKSIEAVEHEDQETTPNHPLRPRHFRTHKLKAGGDIITGRSILLGNEDCVISYFVGSDSSGLYKNATGDEMVFIERGTGTLETVFGAIRFEPGDYLVIPASTIHRYELDDSSEPVRALILETRGHIGPPRRYLSRNGQLLEHAPTASGISTAPPHRSSEPTPRSTCW